MNRKLVLIPLLFISAIASANTAVSEINGKVDSSYGNLNSIDAWISGGSFSAPVADQFGVQFDALYADIGESDIGDFGEFGGFGGHLFWRDSDIRIVDVWSQGRL